MIKDKELVVPSRNGILIFLILLIVITVIYYIFNKCSNTKDNSYSKKDGIRYSLIVSFAIFSNDMLKEDGDILSSIIGGIIAITITSSIIYIIYRLVTKIKKKLK
jgi:hypothetical protein